MTHTDTVVSPRHMRNLGALRSAISGIKADGSTNLCAGLMMGYRNVQRYFNRRHNNRVILLTDGNANDGITDSEEIARKSVEFNDVGIDLSTIGLGYDFNHSLIRQLARSGRGLVHFVGDDKDIKKVFVDELDGLLAGVARDIHLTVNFSRGLTLDHVYGYSPRLGPDGVDFALDPLNSGTTQVVLLRFRVDDAIRRSANLPLTVQLNYQDIATAEAKTVRSSGSLGFRPDERRTLDPLTDASVRRNVTIAEIAEGVKGMAELLEEGKAKKAEQFLASRLLVASDRYSPTKNIMLSRHSSTRTLQIETLRGNYGGGLANDPVYVGNSAEYPNVVFIRVADYVLFAVHKDGALLCYLSDDTALDTAISLCGQSN